MTRRELIQAGAIGIASSVLRLPLNLGSAIRPKLKFAVITDLHHGLAPDAQSRLEAFVEAVGKRNDLDFVLQMGDFCYSEAASAPFLEVWNRIKLPKLHVLGNHDMDKVDKETAMRTWGMRSRYGAHDAGGYRVVWLDLNHFKKDGHLFDYSHGNYFTDNATYNWADPEQLTWLASELRRGDKPTLLVCHQPMGMAEPGQPLPPEQAEVLNVITEAAKAHPKGAVAACMCGHLHVDRVERHQSIPCVLVNSASYFWAGGMYPYSRPLYAFVELTEQGEMVIEGAVGEFSKPPPATSDQVAGRSASIASRSIRLR